MKGKYKKWKEAVRNTPPERLMKINMQGYALSSLGLLIASGFLIYYGIWYIIFAFVFSLFNNYSGFVNSWKQYSQLIELKKELGIPEPEEKSPHRKKVKLIKKQFGVLAGVVTAIWSVALCFCYIFLGFTSWVWYLKPLVVFPIGFIYYILYFKIFFELAKRLEERE